MSSRALSFSLPLIVASLLNACAPAAAPSGVEKASASIRGGKPVSPSSPIAASVLKFGRREKILCTATLLSDRIAVTAAHCLDERRWGRVIEGSQLYLVFGDEKRSLVSWRFHPDWLRKVRAPSRADAFPEGGDIALVKFEGMAPAPFRPALRLSADRSLPKGTEVLLAGFGTTQDPADSASILREARVPVYREAPNPYEVHLDQRGGSGACKGDSGGPAFFEENGQAYLWGVTSQMTEIEDGVDFLCRRTSVYSDLRRVAPWFERSFAELEAEAN